jgi:hypothetical protein
LRSSVAFVTVSELLLHLCQSRICQLVSVRRCLYEEVPGALGPQHDRLRDALVDALEAIVAAFGPDSPRNDC